MPATTWDDLEEMAQRILMVAGGKVVYDGSFDGLRDVAGNRTRFVIATNGKMPELKEGRLLSSENSVFEYEIDFEKTSIRHCSGIYLKWTV